jgi:predicted membrane-bound spermidine synthase
MKKDPVNISKNFYYIISFLEGGAVMVIELLGAKIIAPYYGASLFVWSSVLGVTLGGLALGYFLGGHFSSRFNNQKLLFAIILIGAFFAAISPIIAPKIMYFTDSLGVRLGSLVSVFLYLSPSLICMGMVSPIIIQLISTNNGNAGKAAGSVYAISTVGGIIATFLFGFYLIPELGIRASAYIIGAILGLIAMIYFISARKYIFLAAATGLIIITKIISYHPTIKTNAKILYNSSGLFGQLTVMDITTQNVSGVSASRELLLNEIPQTYTIVGKEPVSLWDYPHKIATIASIKQPGIKTLLLGMGGGSIAYELVKLNFELDIVELDERIPRIARKYFNYDPAKSNLIIDDARHYIRHVKKKYDLVILDLLRGECQPSYIFTMEGFADLQEILNEDALVIINFQGTMEMPEHSKAGRSIYKTLLASGFYTNYGEDPGDFINKDVIFIASGKKYDFKTLLEHPRYYKLIEIDRRYKYENLIKEKAVNVTDVQELTDDKPALEFLNKSIILEWRKTTIANKRGLIKGGMDIY